jgi:hypothetical protein
MFGFSRGCSIGGREPEPTTVLAAGVSWSRVFYDTAADLDDDPFESVVS